MSDLSEYLWIVVVGFIFGFAYAFGIGANDVANAFGTVVASKSLTLKQAVLVASIFEFSGAFLLGASVTNTVRSKIFDVSLYEDEPEILLLGMFSALITGTIMLLGATALSLPVSTTHTIIGSIMGFSIVAKGFDSINWDVVTKIWISWVASPLCTGATAFLFFGILKKTVLDSEHCFDRAYYTFPVILTLTIGINVFYVLYKGMNNFDFSDEIEWYVALPAGLACGFVVGLIWIFAWGPWAKKRIMRYMDAKEAAQVAQETSAPQEKPDDLESLDEIDVDSYIMQAKTGEPMDQEDDVKVVKKPEPRATVEASDTDDLIKEVKPEVPGNMFQRSYRKLADNTFDRDLQTESYQESARAKEIWEDMEHFDPHAEQLFTYVQVFTSCMDSFAHGANDVANAMAPVSALLLLYQGGEIESKAPVPKWILAYGGLGIVIGLLLYGYKIIKSLGYKMTPITPSRGAMAELSSALFVVTASFIGVPVSTTQSQVGAVAGVGLVGGWRNVQWKFFFYVCFSWAVVFFSAIILSAGIFSMFAFTPSLAE